MYKLLEEFGITWWRIAITGGVVSAVNIYGFISQIPRSFWPLLDSYFLANYFFVLGLSFSAAAFFANWSAVFLSSVYYWISKIWRKSWVSDQGIQSTPNSAFEFLKKIFLLLIIFGSIFSGSKFVNGIVVQSMFILVLLLSYYFYIFVTKVDHGIPQGLPRRLIFAWMDDLSEVTMAQLLAQVRTLLPIFLLLLAIWSYKLGEARAYELMENRAYLGNI